MTRFKFVILFVFAFLVVGCSEEEPTPEPTLAHTPTPAPTVTDAPPTATLEPTETPRPTDTPEPTATPIPARALIESGDTQLLLSDWRGAEDAYRQAIANEPENALAHARLAYMLQFHPETYAEAVEVGREAAELGPNDPAVVSFLILALIRNGQFDEALSYGDQIKALAFNDPLGSAVLAELYLSIGDYEEADRFVQIGLSLSGFAFGVEEVELNRILALHSFLKGSRGVSLQYSSRLLESAPDFAPAYLVGAEVVTSGRLRGQTQRDLIVEGLILDSDYLPLMTRLAQIDAQAGNYALALDSCEDVIRLFAEMPDGLLCQGDVLLEQGEFEQAVAAFNQVFEQDEADYRPYIGRGRAVLGLEDCETAEADFLTALELQPYASQGYVSLAEAYQCQGETAEAETAYQEALDLKPFDSATNFSLGTLYFGQARFEEAREAFTTAILNSPAGNTPSAYFISLGQSLQALNACSPLNPPELAYYLCSGDLFLERGAPFLAVGAYSLALEIDENSVRALEGSIVAYANERLCDVADSFFERLTEIATPSAAVNDVIDARCAQVALPDFFTPNGELVSEDEAVRLIETAALQVEGIDSVTVLFDTVEADDPELGEARLLLVQFISNLDKDDPELNRILSELVFAAAEGFVLADSEPLLLVVQARLGLTEPPAGFIVSRFSAIGWYNGTVTTAIFRQTWSTFDEIAEQIEQQG